MSGPLKRPFDLLMLGVLVVGCQRAQVETTPKGEAPGVVKKTPKDAAPKAQFEATGGIDPKHIAAWEKAGATFGWLGFGSFGTKEFSTKRPLERVRIGAGNIFDSPAVPCFQAKKELPAGIPSLPAPAVPFGLDFNHCAFDDADLRRLGRFQQLQILQVCDTGVTDEGLAELAKWPRLQFLVVCSTKITDEGLAKLAALPELRGLDIGGMDITDAGLREVARIEKLHTLRLFRTKITDEGLKELAKLPHLDTLDLQSTKVSDAGLKTLARCSRLRYLILLSTDRTEAGVAELQKALPECVISVN